MTNCQETIFQNILDGVSPDEELPGEQANAILHWVAEFNRQLYEVLKCFSQGRTDTSLKFRGRIAGALKALQSDLRHLTWQAEQVAKGDFSQRVIFLGEFAEAFNRMVENLSRNKSEIESRNREIMRIDNELKQDLHVAAQVQQSFAGKLPEPDFAAVGVLAEPFFKVSGDFFSTFVESEGLFFMLGDASGHGAAAAMITIMARSFLANVLPLNPTEEILRRMNEFFASTLPDDMYMTGVIGCLNNSGHLRVANAGHPPMLIHRRARGEFEEVSGTGMVLGMFEEEIEPYTSCSIELMPGDRIYVFSDGLLEMRGEQGFLGMSGLRDFLENNGSLSIHENLDFIRALIFDSEKLSPRADDITVAAIEFTGRSCPAR
ncbi:MAG TPA: SpoIIE family protein phosphatase [Candidatus Rifleibacterium sp.]|nr:SpoIIE family protein phosphatase [Candidatus Rifleibacterium sp.]